MYGSENWGNKKDLSSPVIKVLTSGQNLSWDLKIQGDVPRVLCLASKEMERIHLIIWNYFMENLSSLKQAKLFSPNCLSLSLEAHVLNSNALQLYGACLRTGHFPTIISLIAEKEVLSRSLRSYLGQHCISSWASDPSSSPEIKTSLFETIERHWSKNASSGYWGIDQDLDGKFLSQTLGLSFLFPNIFWIPCYTDWDTQNSKEASTGKPCVIVQQKLLLTKCYIFKPQLTCW